jgi:hypothetical protein
MGAANALNADLVVSCRPSPSRSASLVHGHGGGCADLAQAWFPSFRSAIDARDDGATSLIRPSRTIGRRSGINDFPQP